MKRDESIRYVLGLGCVDAMVVGFEKIEEVDDFAARDQYYGCNARREARSSIRL